MIRLSVEYSWTGLEDMESFWVWRRRKKNLKHNHLMLVINLTWNMTWLYINLEFYQGLQV